MLEVVGLVVSVVSSGVRFTDGGESVLSGYITGWVALAATKFREALRGSDIFVILGRVNEFPHLGFPRCVRSLQSKNRDIHED